MKVQLQVINTINGFKDIAQAWDNCLLSMSAPSMFLTSRWLIAWWNAWGHDLKMHVLTLNDVDGILAGAAICFHGTKYYGVPIREFKFIGEPAADRQEFICRPQNEDMLNEIWRALEAQSQNFDIVRLEEIPESSSTILSSKGHLAKVEIEPSSQLPYLSSVRSWEDFERGLAYKFRSEMRTREKVFDSWGEWSFEIIDGSNVAKYVGDIECVERESRKASRGYALLSDPRNAEFIRSLVTTANDLFTPLLSVLRLEDKIIGYLLGFRFRQKYYAYNMAFLPEYAKGSPGKWIMHNTIRHAAQIGLGEFDFLRGAHYIKI